VSSPFFFWLGLDTKPLLEPGMVGKEKGKGEGRGVCEQKQATKRRQDDRPPPSCVVLFLQRTNPTIHIHNHLLGSNELIGFKDRVFCGGRWGVTAGESGEGPYRGRGIQIQIPMGRPSLPRRRGRHARAAVIEKGGEKNRGDLRECAPQAKNW
jgi:hypothetical protein